MGENGRLGGDAASVRAERTRFISPAQQRASASGSLTKSQCENHRSGGGHRTDEGEKSAQQVWCRPRRRFSAIAQNSWPYGIGGVCSWVPVIGRSASG